MEAHQHLASMQGVDGEYDPLGPTLNDTSMHSSSRPSASTTRSSESTNRGKLSSTASHRGSHESKPRLSKDQHERLEREFRNNRKPSTAVKKQFSQQLGISLEKVNNWFQNRRAKVKHEEKKHRGSLPAWPSELHSGVPLSEYEFLDAAFLQTQEPSHVSQGVHFPNISQSDLDPNVPVSYGNGAGIGDCPTIHEEPTAPDDSNAFMSFMGIDPQDGRHIQLQDVSHISKQFNPHTAAGDGFSNQSQYPPAFTPTHHSVDTSHYGRSISGSTLAHSHMEDQNQMVASHFNSRRPSSNVDPNAGMTADTHDFGESWMVPHQHAPHLPQESTSFGIEDARQMVSQLQARASQAQQTPVEHHAFAHPTAQTELMNPQPMLPSQPPAFDSPEPDHAYDEHAWAGQQDTQMQTMPDNMRALSRTDSGTSMLAESMGGVNIGPAHATIMRPPSQTPSLSFAQRRQKRPANISATASRSYSGSQTPLSASEKHGSSSTEANLRRIKSSSGVLNGRIHKSSGQRSPLYQSHFADSHPHLSRQISTNSLNAAMQKDEGSNSSQPPPMPPHSATMHGQQHSSSSGFTHLTIPEDASQTPESVWSRMPSTADTTNTSLYYSVPQTANTVKSYTSPPHTPMDPAQLASMQLHHPEMHHSEMHHPVPSSFTHPFQHHPHPPYPQQMHPQAMTSPYEQGAGQHQLGPFHFSTDDLVMNTIPMTEQQAGPPPVTSPLHQDVHSSPIHQSPMHHAVATMHMHQGQGQPQPQHPPHHHQQPMMIVPPQPHQHTPDVHQHEFVSTPQHQQFVWNLQPGPSHPDNRQNQDLQIHQFTPSNPVDPSNLPPKTNKPSPGQTYSFQNFGPDHYSSPKSQSSQSKSSTPGPLNLGS